MAHSAPLSSAAALQHGLESKDPTSQAASAATPAARRLLIVSYHFPPDASVGGLRPARFARTLPEFGWQPYVLTARDERRDILDCGRAAGLGAATVLKAREFRGLRALYGALKVRLRPQEATGANATIQRENSKAARPRGAWAARLRRLVISFVVFLPDDKKGWALLAAAKAILLIRRHKIDCILTSSPPASVHLVGALAKMLTGVSWIADLRDPWIESVDRRPARTRSAAADAIEARMERAVVGRADRVVTTTRHLQEQLKERYPTLPGGKFVHIPNGVDRELFEGTGGAKYERLTITYAGTLYDGRTPEPLFRALGGLVADGLVRPEDIRVVLLGDCEWIDGLACTEMIRRYRLEDVAELRGVVSHTDAIRIMKKSHVLLVLAPEHHRLTVPAKIYEYLGAGSRILAIAEPGATADFIRETKCGVCFSHADVAGIRRYLQSLLAMSHVREDTGAAQWLDRFDGKRVTAQLASELSLLCGERIGR